MEEEKKGKFMTLEEFHARVEAEEKALNAKPFFVRVPIKIGTYVWCRIILNLPDLPRKIKWKLQRLFRGYADCDLWNLDSFIINKIYRPLKKFVKHQEEEGTSLPQEFATDPAAWLLVLKKIEFSFDHEWREEHELGYDPYKNLTPEQKIEFDDNVQKGFELFGRHLRGLWD